MRHAHCERAAPRRLYLPCHNSNKLDIVQVRIRCGRVSQAVHVVGNDRRHDGVVAPARDICWRKSGHALRPHCERRTHRRQAASDCQRQRSGALGVPCPRGMVVVRMVEEETRRRRTAL